MKRINRTRPGIRLGLPAPAAPGARERPGHGRVRRPDDRRQHARLPGAGDQPPAGLLHPGGRRAHRPAGGVRGRTFCEFKGQAKYFDVAVGDRRAERAVWTYPDPTLALRRHPGLLFLLPQQDGRLLGRRRAGAAAGGRLLRRLDHQQDRRPVQGRGRYLGLVSGASYRLGEAGYSRALPPRPKPPAPSIAFYLCSLRQARDPALRRPPDKRAGAPANGVRAQHSRRRWIAAKRGRSPLRGPVSRRL